MPEWNRRLRTQEDDGWLAATASPASNTPRLVWTQFGVYVPHGLHLFNAGRATFYREQRAVQRLDEDVHRPRLCAAIVDRLTFAGQIIEIGTISYRLAHPSNRVPGLPAASDAA